VFERKMFTLLICFQTGALGWPVHVKTNLFLVMEQTFSHPNTLQNLSTQQSNQLMVQTHQMTYTFTHTLHTMLLQKLVTFFCSDGPRRFSLCMASCFDNEKSMKTRENLGLLVKCCVDSHALISLLMKEEDSTDNSVKLILACLVDQIGHWEPAFTLLGIPSMCTSSQRNCY
jgi:hypothetical protein